MTNNKPVIGRRMFLRKSATVGLAGIAGASLMGGLDRTVLALPPSNPSSEMSQWLSIQGVSCVVYADSTGQYYVRDNGIGNIIGALIVNANVITAYGNSLGAGTTGASTTTAGIQEAINCLRGSSGLGGGIVQLVSPIYNTTSTILLYPGISLRGMGLISAFQNIGACAIQPNNSLNAPVIKMIVDASNNTNVVFPRCEGFAINGGGVANTSQDGIQISSANGAILDAYINDVGVFSVGGNSLNIQQAGTAGKHWVREFYSEDCLQNGILQNGGFLRVVDSYIIGNALFGLSTLTGYQLVEIFNNMFSSNTGGAISIVGATTYGSIITGNRITLNGGVATPQVSLSGNSGLAQRYIVASNKFADGRGGGTQVNNHLVLGTSGTGSIVNNDFSGSTNIAVDPGTFLLLNLHNNKGLNPIGKITNPFLTNHINYLHGNAAVPTASTDYGIYTCDVIVTAADSANTNNAIIIKDAVGGNTLTNPVSTLNGYFIPQGYAINWGAFTGAAGAVTISGI